MVRLDEKPSLREASCWRVEVMNGGAALRRRSLLLTSATTQVAARARSAAAVASASRLQYSWGLKASISRSRSTIIFRAADWTRPADRPARTLRHRTGDSL